MPDKTFLKELVKHSFFKNTIISFRQHCNSRLTISIGTKAIRNLPKKVPNGALLYVLIHVSLLPSVKSDKKYANGISKINKMQFIQKVVFIFQMFLWFISWCTKQEPSIQRMFSIPSVISTFSQISGKSIFSETIYWQFTTKTSISETTIKNLSVLLTQKK